MGFNSGFKGLISYRPLPRSVPSYVASVLMLRHVLLQSHFHPAHVDSNKDRNIGTVCRKGKSAKAEVTNAKSDVSFWITDNVP